MRSACIRDRQCAKKNGLLPRDQGLEARCSRIGALRLMRFARVNSSVLGTRLTPSCWPRASIMVRGNRLSMPPRDLLVRGLDVRDMTLTRATIEGHEVVSYLAPLAAADHSRYGVVQVLQRESFIEEDERATRRSIAVFTAIMVLAVGTILFVVTRVTVSAPISDLMRRVRDIGSGDFKTRVRVHRNDELGRLADEFNRMAEKLDHT